MPNRKTKKPVEPGDSSEQSAPRRPNPTQHPAEDNQAFAKKKSRRRRRRSGKLGAGETPTEQQPPGEIQPNATASQRPDPIPPKTRQDRLHHPAGKISAKIAEQAGSEVSQTGARRREPAHAVQPKAKARHVQPALERFGELELSGPMLAALAEAGYQEPTPVQAGLIPKALEGRDLMGQARTGTGKTAAFAIPLLEGLADGPRSRNPAALILVPTRELAVQVRDEFAKLIGKRKLSAVAVYGGKPIRSQIEHLRQGAEIVVGTPGRVLDLMDRRALDLGSLGCVVLDEADRMLDIGFRPDIEKILRRCPQSRQTLLLSATIPPPVKRLAERYMRDPEMLDFSPKDVAVETIEQFYFTVDPQRKFDLLARLIERENPYQAIVFCRTKRGTDRVGARLARKFKGAAVIHGDLPQRQRDRVMADFRAGKVQFLVATDVVGRGIDVTSISHIINFDIPEFCDDYVHRVGRTGRMGREGVAYTFVSPEEGSELTRIEIRINRLLKRDEIPGFDAIARPEPAAVAAAEPPKPKPVFGQRTRRIRRAL